MAISKSIKDKCLNCQKPNSHSRRKYCSNNCQLEYQYSIYIEQWKKGEKTGLQSLGIVSKYVKKYLRKKYGNKCCICGWCEVHPKTGQVPLVADHMDGNWRNNLESNLRLICPNCDALTLTYAGLNKGKGRRNRAISIRSQEARKLNFSVLRRMG